MKRYLLLACALSLALSLGCGRTKESILTKLRQLPPEKYLLFATDDERKKDKKEWEERNRKSLEEQKKEVVRFNKEREGMQSDLHSRIRVLKNEIMNYQATIKKIEHEKWEGTYQYLDYIEVGPAGPFGGRQRKPVRKQVTTGLYTLSELRKKIQDIEAEAHTLYENRDLGPAWDKLHAESRAYREYLDTKDTEIQNLQSSIKSAELDIESLTPRLEDFVWEGTNLDTLVRSKYIPPITYKDLQQNPTNWSYDVCFKDMEALEAYLGKPDSVVNFDGQLLLTYRCSDGAVSFEAIKQPKSGGHKVRVDFDTVNTY